MKPSFLSRLKGGAVISTLLIAGLPASAQTAASYNGGGTLLNFGNATGWGFTVSSPTSVQALGVFDEDGDGLASAHAVGIFVRSSLAMVTSASIPAGTVAPLIDGNRLTNIAPVVLNPGVEYYMLTDNLSTDRYVFGVGAVAFTPGVNWLGFVDGSTNSITSTPTFNGGVPGNLGPTFYVGAPANPYKLSWWTVDGGGGKSASGALILEGTSGQPDAGKAAGGFYTLASGFWSTFVPDPCYVNCDASTSPPILNINDFNCFLNKFAAGCS